MSKCEIRTELNKPSLYIDGRPVPPVLYGLSDIPGAKSNTAYAKRNIARFAKAGIRLVNVDTGLHLGWHKVSEFDPSAMIAEISGALDANPEAKVLVRLHMNPPYWWLRDKPGECVIYRTPDGDSAGIDDGESDRLIRHDADHHMRVSLASEKWLAEASDKLRLLCKALRGTPEGDALMGMQVACGIYGEWHQWGTDVSEPMKRRFVRFLREKYQTVESLRSAWGDAQVTFESAKFHPETFRPGDDGFFRDPQRSRFVMDAQECIQSTPPDAILRFCRVIREELPDILTGTFYGYYFGTGGNNMTIGGHLQVRRLYASPDVDFLCGPFCYMKNREPDGVPMQRGLLESSRLRGKLWLTEMDQHPDCVPRLGGDPALRDQTIAILRRNVLQPLEAGHGLWYYDHRVIPHFLADHPELAVSASIYRKTGWWEDEFLMEEIEKLQRTAEELCAKPYASSADVLMVYDTDSYYCRAKVVDCEYRIHEAVARCDVSYDCIYADELELAELERYKCVIFVNVYMQTPERREQYRRLLRGKKVIHLYAEGYCDGETLSCENLSSAIGMKVKRISPAQSFRFGGIEVQIPENSFDPMFALDDASAVPLAYYDYGEIAAAKKGNDIWLALPLPTREIMSALFSGGGGGVPPRAGCPRGRSPG